MIKCKKIIQKEGRYYMGYVVPEGKGLTSAIVMVAGYIEEEAASKLETAILEWPPKYTAKYTF